MDRTSVERLFATYREPVYRFLRRFLYDGPAAEDLTQETFLRALGGRWDAAGGHERAWIFQIARNLAHDHLRALGRRPVMTPLTDHEGRLADQALTLALDAAIAGLEEVDREVFLLKELGGLSYVEIASTCRLTPDAVRSRLHRTRLTLRKQLT